MNDFRRTRARPAAVTALYLAALLALLAGYCAIITVSVAPVTPLGAIVAVMIGWTAFMTLCVEVLR